METAGAKSKPVIFSEFGVGGIDGFHDPFSRVKWSEEVRRIFWKSRLRRF